MLGAEGANGFLFFFLRCALPLPLTTCSGNDRDTNRRVSSVEPPHRQNGHAENKDDSGTMLVYAIARAFVQQLSQEARHAVPLVCDIHILQRHLHVSRDGLLNVGS